MTTQTALFRTGHGYEQSADGPCNAFDGLEIIANPLGGFSAADRERRGFDRADGSPGVTYGSHALYLLRGGGDDTPNRREYFVAVHNGAGRQVWRLPACFGYLAETVDALAAMPERALYSLLWGIVEALDNTRRAERDDVRRDWIRAAVQKRVKVSRQPSKGRAFAWIEPERREGETEEQHKVRCIFAKPAGVK